MEPILSGRDCVAGIDTNVYPLDAILKTVHQFTDRCYVFMYYDSGGVLRVRLRTKPVVELSLEELAGEFMNELLNQTVRLRIARDTSNLRELIMARALYTEALEVQPAAGNEDISADDEAEIARDFFADQSERGAT